MALADTSFWHPHLEQTLGHYDETLLREVAGNLVKPRSHWPVQELIDRCLTVWGNPAVIDRRIQDVDAHCRGLLACVGCSGEARWRVGSLVEAAAALGCPDGLQAVIGLLRAGLALPSLDTAPARRLKDFEHWLTLAGERPAHVVIPPLVGVRALSIGGHPIVPDWHGSEPHAPPAASIRESDGLEMPLRLAIVWQRACKSALRKTQQGDFFKRDLDQLRNDTLFTATPSDHVGDIADLGLLSAALAQSSGLLQAQDSELAAGPFPQPWNDSLAALLRSLWQALLHTSAWQPQQGWQPLPELGDPFPSAYLLAIVILARLGEGEWARADAIDRWIGKHHPYWAVAHRDGKAKSLPSIGISAFLLGLAYQMKLVQAHKSSAGDWLVRLSPLGRWLFGQRPEPPTMPSYAQTLLVQPNLQIFAYRQGLTPELIMRLSRVAAWEALGAACTLQLQPETVYRALEAGETFESIVQLFERHGARAVPDPVLNSLRTWSSKRERITVYPAAALFEFSSDEDLQEALARGLPATRISDRLAVVAGEQQIDYRHFRLLATRDYALPAGKCIEVGADGVTLKVDLARADLLLATELERFAEPLAAADGNGQTAYRLTRPSLARARKAGLHLAALEAWFELRCGQPLTPAARLLATADDIEAIRFENLIVLQVHDPLVADGLMQLLETRALIHERLGPRVLSIPADNLNALRKKLAALDVKMET